MQMLDYWLSTMTDYSDDRPWLQEHETTIRSILLRAMHQAFYAPQAIELLLLIYPQLAGTTRQNWSLLLNEALLLAQGWRDNHLQARLWHYMGDTQARTYHVLSAQIAYDIARRHARDEDDPHLLLDVYSARLSLPHQCRAEDIAETKIAQMAAIAEASADRRDHARFFQAVGNAYLQRGQLEDALNYCASAHDLWGDLDERGAQAETMLTLAAIYRHQGRPNEAREYLNLVAALFEDQPDAAPHMAFIATERCALDHQDGATASALQQAQNAQAELNRIGDPKRKVYREGHLFHLLGQLHATQQEPLLSLSYHEAAFHRWVSLGHTYYEAIECRCLSHYLIEQGRYDLARALLERGRGLQRTLPPCPATDQLGEQLQATRLTITQ